MKSKKIILSIILILVLVIIGGGTYYYTNSYSLHNKTYIYEDDADINNEILNNNINELSNNSANANIGDNAQTFNKPFSPSEGFANLVDFVNPAVVNITSIKIVQSQGNDMPLDGIDPDFRELFKNLIPQQLPNKQRFVGVGTGFVIRSDGFIVTNNHVIQETEKIQVTFENGTKYDAVVYATDSLTDLALLKIDAKNLPTLKLGDSNKARVGDFVITVGNPYGLGGTVSFGIISAKSRNINIGNYNDYIQTDAAINRGNSGGPMINTKGEVIGINTAIFSTQDGGSIGIGFALPSNAINNIVTQLITTKKVVRSWLGVQIQGFDDNIAKALNVKNTNGALISGLVKDSPADKSGLKIGDVITGINGKEIKNSRVLPQIISNMPPETTVTLTIVSNKETKDVKVILKPIPQEVTEASNNNNNKNFGATGTKVKDKTYDALGIKVAEINEAVKKFFNLSTEAKGVIILGIKNDSIAKQKNLGGGLRIVSVNQQPIENIEQLDKALNSNQNEILLFLLETPTGDTFFVSISKKEVEQGYPD